MSDAQIDLDLISVGGFFLRRDDEHFVRLGDELPSYQQKVRTAAYRYVQNWRLAIDVGGHIGIFSRDFAAHFREVHAFEPMPFNRVCLKRNAATNTTVHACGLGSTAGTTQMRYNWKNSGGSEVVDPSRIDSSGEASGAAQPGDKFVSAEIRTLDSFGFTDVGLIKIDVQGMEEHVLKGARETLMRSRPVVILEEKVVKSRPNDTRAIEAAAALMQAYGFRRTEMVGQDAIYTAIALTN